MITDDAIDELFQRVQDALDRMDTSSPSSPPDYSIPGHPEWFRAVVREWLDDVRGAS